MPHRYLFDADVLHSVAGGRSAIDIPKLSIHRPEAADAFLVGYGFDLSKPGVEDRLWYFHRRALVLLTERLGFAEADIPEILRDRRQTGDIRKLLMWASSSRADERELQRWSCALLRCMHVYVHAEQDLFGSFSEEIQAQILTPFQNVIVHAGTDTTILKASADHDPLKLVGFEVKPFKTSQSTVIKLLAKPDALAMRIFDKLGVRFVTGCLLDSFKVIRYLVDENIISFPHIMPDQSSNNLYPVDLFVNVCRGFEGRPDVSPDEVNAELEARLLDAGEKAGFFRKQNEQSGSDFRFIKFIARKLIEVRLPGKEPFQFFYPYEVQIMDQGTRAKIQSGPSEHEAYKDRQKVAARRRLFPDAEEHRS